jgi:PAT family beta-lactamase induction signal transducer AmpG
MTLRDDGKDGPAEVKRSVVDERAQPQESAARKPSMFRLWSQPKMLALAFLGFSSGLPLYLTTRTLQAWMTQEGVDLTTIGMFSLVALPYSLKFLWAPLMDRFVPPFLGRRRGWLMITQLALMAAIGAMSLQDPTTALRLLAFNAILIAFFSASQDIVIDAYRADILTNREMGAGAAIWVVGYRVALLTTGSLAFILADRMPWPSVYLAMAALMLVGIVTTLRAPEPVLREPPPHTFREAVFLPFQEFFTRAGTFKALLVLAFIVLYKLPDYLAATMAIPFLLDAGYSQTDIGAIQGGLGLISTIVGALSGGVVVARMGINRSLWVFGGLQALSNLAYYTLSLVGQSYPFLVVTIVIENFCTGLVTAGFLAFLMSLCSARFSATQYALLSSLMGVSRDLLSAPAGGIAETTGWPSYFLITLIAAVPGLLLLPVFAPWNRDTPLIAASHPGETVDADTATKAGSGSVD